MPDCSKSLFDLTFGEAHECFLQSPTATKIVDSYHELLNTAANATIGEWSYGVGVLVWFPSVCMIFILAYQFLQIAYLKFVRKLKFEHNKTDLRAQVRTSVYMIFGAMWTIPIMGTHGEGLDGVTVPIMAGQVICGFGAMLLPQDWFGKPSRANLASQIEGQ